MEPDGESHPCTLQTTAFDIVLTFTLDFPDSSVGKESACKAVETPVQFLVGKIPWRRVRLPPPVFLGFPGGSASKESYGNEGDLGSIPEKGTATHSSILVWRIPRTILSMRSQRTGQH